MLAIEALAVTLVDQRLPSLDPRLLVIASAALHTGMLAFTLGAAVSWSGFVATLG